MSIKLGIYDFFAYVIPGSIVIIAILYVLIEHFGFIIDYGNISIIGFLLMAILAFLLGYVNDFLSRKSWYKLFFRNKNIQSVIENLNRDNHMFEIIPEQLDWYTCLAYIKKQNLDMAQDIDKLNVQSIMLRNSSFGFLIFTGIFAVEFFLSGYSYIYMIGSLACLGISIVMMRESIKFVTWFVQAIYKSLVVFILTPEQLPIKIKSKVKKSRTKKKTDN